ncbi:MAG: hypothetical protein NT149_03050 [Candidatus Gottesmanbacteria bacterium]|nr:hypothetical protein [Candidatus Gottesmanbacteria bacterium]
MISDADIKKMKKVFTTKDDLKDLRGQLNDDIDGKLVHQKKEIVKEVGEYIADTIVPMFDKRDKQIARIEKKVGLPLIVD